MYLFPFEKLEVWQQAKKLSVLIYSETANFPKEELYGIVSQIRRSVNSVSANISEGTARISGKEQARYTEIAYGSLMETVSHLEIAKALNFFDAKIVNQEIRPQIVHLANMLRKLRQYQLSINKK